MPLQNLDNLVKAGQLKEESPVQSEFDGLVNAAKFRLRDAENSALSAESQFELSYSAAHSLALAALRWHGYRSESRYIVFQCLVHTVGMDSGRTRILSDAHNKRNKSAYEGETDVSDGQVQSMITIGKELLALVIELGPIV